MAQEVNINLMLDALKVAEGCAKINANAGIPQTNFVTEESSEFNIAVAKMARGKDTREHMLDEAMDVISACTVLMIQQGVSFNDVFQHIYDKCSRALELNARNGEI